MRPDELDDILHDLRSVSLALELFAENNPDIADELRDALDELDEVMTYLEGVR